MQHGDHSAFGIQSGEEKLLHGLPYRPEQEVIHCGGVCQKEWIKFIWHGKDHMEIGNRQKILLSVLDPCFTLGILALGAMTVPAAIIAYADMSAGVAPVHMTAQGCGAATANRAQGPENIPVGLIFIRELTAEAFNNLRQFEGRPQTFW